jgi:adenylate cyclase
VLAPLGRFAEAELHSVHACELDPFSPVPAAALGIHFTFTRRPDRAEIACGRALELDPRFPWAHWGLGRARLLQGRFAEAENEFRTLPPVFAGGLLGYCCAVTGRADEARRILRAFDERELSDRVSLSYQAAILHVGLGEPDRVFERLERARSERSLSVQWVAVDPVWDGIREDPRFSLLLQRMNIFAHDTAAAGATAPATVRA